MLLMPLALDRTLKEGSPWWPPHMYSAIDACWRADLPPWGCSSAQGFLWPPEPAQPGPMKPTDCVRGGSVPRILVSAPREPPTEVESCNPLWPLKQKGSSLGTYQEAQGPHPKPAEDSGEPGEPRRRGRSDQEGLAQGCPYPWPLCLCVT